MKQVQVLGSGCSKCQATARLVQEVADGQGVAIELTKVEDPARIVALGVMSTPGVVVDGKVVHAGGIPSKERIAQWLA